MKTRVIILIGVLVLLTVAIHIVLFKPLADQWQQVTADTDASLPKYKTIMTDYDPEGVVVMTRKIDDFVAKAPSPKEVITGPW